MNGYTWLRLYHGTFNDPKWPLVARLSKQTVGVVVSIWTPLLECASMNEDRGSVDKFCPEEIDVLYGYADGTTASVFQVMKERGIITPDNRIAAWDKRQNIPAEDAPEDRRAYKREWARKKREESRIADSPASGQSVDSCGQLVDSCRHDVDTSGQLVDNCRHHKEKIREDKIRDLKHTPLTPQGETGVGVSTPAQTSSPLKARETPGPDQEPKPDPKPKPEPPAEDPPQAPDATTDPATPPQADLTHGNPAWKEFCYVFSLWPLQQGKEKAWREYAYLRARHLVPESYALADIIERFKAEDRRWKRGYVPMMANWLHDRRWDDVPEKAPAKSYAPDENGRQMYVDEADQNYSEPSKFCGLTELI